MLTELARLSVAHAHPRANRAYALGIGGARAAAAPARLPALRPDIPVVHASALSRLRFFVTTDLSSGVRRPRGFAVSGRVLVPHGGCRRRAAVFGRPGALPVLQVHVGVFAVVGAVSAPVRRRWLAGRTEVRVDPLLELGGYLRVVAEAGGPFDGLFVRGDLHELANVVHPHDVHGNQRGQAAEEAGLDADVLGHVVLVNEEVVDLADLLVVPVVDLVPFEPLTYVFLGHTSTPSPARKVPGGHLARSDRLPRPLLCAGPPRRSPRPRRPSCAAGPPPLARRAWRQRLPPRRPAGPPRPRR